MMNREDAVDRALLYTFQLSGRDYRKMQRALSEVTFIRALEQDGWTVARYRAIPPASQGTLFEAVERVRSYHDRSSGHVPTNTIGYCGESDGISATYCETGILLAGLTQSEDRRGDCEDGLSLAERAYEQMEVARDAVAAELALARKP